MQKTLVVLICSILILSCDNESFLRLQANASAVDFIPSFTQAASYRSSTDTISMSKSYEGSYFDQAPGISSGSGLGDFDRLELERRELILRTDSPVYRIDYLLETEFDPKLTQRSKDVITITLYEEAIGQTAELQLEYSDTLRCLAANCTFTDTLVIDSVNYFNVYYLAVDSSLPAIFINQNQGVVGFRDSQSKTYQRIK